MRKIWLVQVLKLCEDIMWAVFSRLESYKALPMKIDSNHNNYLKCFICLFNTKLEINVIFLIVGGHSVASYFTDFEQNFWQVSVVAYRLLA